MSEYTLAEAAATARFLRSARDSFGAAAPAPVIAPAARRGVRPVTLLRGAVALMLIGNLGRIPVLWAAGKDAPLLVNEIVLLATLAVAALACVQARALRFDGVCFAGLAFVGVGLAGALRSAADYGFSGGELLYSLAYLARWAAYFGLYVAVLNTARADDAEPLWRTLERMVLVFAAFGVVQTIFLPGFAQLVYPETGDQMVWDHQGYRLVSTLLDPNFAGALILLPLLVQLGRLAYGARVAWWKPVLLVAALLMTFSRSSVLALFVGGAVVVAVTGVRRRLLALGGGLAVAVLPFVPLIIRGGQTYAKFTVSDESALARTVAWARGLTVFLDHPVLGVGFDTYGFVQRRYGWDIVGRDAFGLDGGLLFIAVLTGVVGLTVYLVMLGLVVRRCRRVWRDRRATGAARGTALGVAAAVPALVVHSCVSASLILPFIMEPFWVLAGIVFLHACAGRERTARAAVPA